jgi:hypothetical protein
VTTREDHPREARYSFRGGRGEWPTDRPAHSATITIFDADLDDDVTLGLTPEETESLAREALRALAYTKVPRRDGQWESTWQREVEDKTESMMALVAAYLPSATPAVV